MPAPTTYFPSVLYKIGFEQGRRWNTSRSDENPLSGRVQRFKNWTTPKRRLTLTVVGLDGTSYSVSATTVATVRAFLNTVAGAYGNFYIFNPHAENYVHAADPVQTYCGPFDTAFPQVCPFRGGTITNIYKNGTLYKTTGNFTQDSSGPGGETRIASVTGGLPADGDIITVDVTGAYERIPVVQLVDFDDFRYDWTAANPATEIGLKLEEDFG